MPPKKFKKPMGRAKVPRSALQRLSKVSIGDIGSFLGEAAGVARRLLNVEVKRFDTSIGSTSNSTGGVGGCLTLIAEGDDYNNRDARSLRTVALEARVTVTLDPAKALTDTIRLIMYADSENQGANPAAVDVLQAATPTSPFNADTLQRFTVFHDEVFSLDTYAGQVAVRDLKIPLDVHIRFRGVAGAVASCAENNLFYLIVSRSAVAATSAFTIDSRLSFVDN